MTASEYATALRAVADFFDTHPDCPVPTDPSISCSVSDTKEEAVRLARLLMPCDKEWGPMLFSLIKNVGGIPLKFLFWRSAVCTRRVVGTREIPRREVEAHTEEIVEWDCEPILQDAKAGAGTRP